MKLGSCLNEISRKFSTKPSWTHLAQCVSLLPTADSEMDGGETFTIISMYIQTSNSKWPHVLIDHFSSPGSPKVAFKMVPCGLDSEALCGASTVDLGLRVPVRCLARLRINVAATHRAALHLGIAAAMWVSGTGFPNSKKIHMTIAYHKLPVSPVSNCRCLIVDKSPPSKW